MRSETGEKVCENCYATLNADDHATLCRDMRACQWRAIDYNAAETVAWRETIETYGLLAADGSIRVVNAAPLPAPYVHDFAYTAELVWMIDAGYPAPIIAAFLELLAADWRTKQAALDAAYREYRDYRLELSLNYHRDTYRENYARDFAGACSDIGIEDVEICNDCADVVWQDDAYYVECLSASVCSSCLDAYPFCESCNEHVRRTFTVDGTEFCRDCRDCLNYCPECGEHYLDDNEDHYHDDDDDDNEEDCDCAARFSRFNFPANGAGTIHQNERLTVELPAGTIDERGMSRIVDLLVTTTLPLGHECASQYYGDKFDYYTAQRIVEEVGPTWQMKRGNFTRRLSAALHKNSVKLDDGLLSAIGNIAREHSSSNAAWYVEVTRDLNNPADEFAHEDSCWWATYSGSRPSSALTSRCSLKSWGGLALRTYADDNARRTDPSGRAWMIPLGADMMPTHDATNARAFVVFNGYENLSGYVAARIVAHLADRTYRKIKFNADTLYVNDSSSGGAPNAYLIADQATCDATDSLYFSLGEHDLCDASSYAAVSTIEGRRAAARRVVDLQLLDAQTLASSDRDAFMRPRLAFA